MKYTVKFEINGIEATSEEEALEQAFDRISDGEEPDTVEVIEESQ